MEWLPKRRGRCTRFVAAGRVASSDSDTGSAGDVADETVRQAGHRCSCALSVVVLEMKSYGFAGVSSYGARVDCL